MGVILVRPLTDGFFQRLTGVAVPQLDMLKEGWRPAYAGQQRAGHTDPGPGAAACSAHRRPPL